MKVSKKAEYGLRAMVHLAKNKKTISIRELSNDEGMPFEFLSKIFADLERAKLVKAKHGANGGYFLAKPAKAITAGNIVETLEGKITPVKCSLCGKANDCASKDVWDKLDMALNKTLRKITLAELI